MKKEEGRRLWREKRRRGMRENQGVRVGKSEEG